ncbi:MAG: hypothetical protein V1837_02205 [Candidatus Woesearchaeota archaeon]
MEREVIVDKMRFDYEGLFSIPELYKLIDEWFEDKNYDKREIRNIERVSQDGKFIEIEILPWKKVSDYAKNEIRLRMFMSEIKDMEVEKEGVKVKLNQGKLHIVFDGYLSTDYENRWEQKPMFFFLRTIFDKYLYEPFQSGFQAGVRKDVYALRDQIKSFLNLYRF